MSPFRLACLKSDIDLETADTGNEAAAWVIYTAGSADVLFLGLVSICARLILSRGKLLLGAGVICWLGFWIEAADESFRGKPVVNAVDRLSVFRFNNLNVPNAI